MTNISNGRFALTALVALAACTPATLAPDLLQTAPSATTQRSESLSFPFQFPQMVEGQVSLELNLTAVMRESESTESTRGVIGTSVRQDQTTELPLAVGDSVSFTISQIRDSVAWTGVVCEVKNARGCLSLGRTSLTASRSSTIRVVVPDQFRLESLSEESFVVTGKQLHEHGIKCLEARTLAVRRKQNFPPEIIGEQEPFGDSKGG